MRVGVLTGGGDCPGLNAVIRAVVRKGVTEYGYEFVGFRDGWKGPLEGLTTDLGIAQVRGILPRGGTILGSSRTNPIKIEGGVEAIKANLAAQGVDALIAIGGEDTLGVATALHDHGVPVVGVPKTIDNDLSATDYTFGFDTAVNIASEAIDRLHTTAESHHRILVVEVMGRHAGWIALHAGLSGGANGILIPEVPFDLDEVAGWVETRFRSHYSPIIVVSEGALPADGDLITKDQTLDAFGHVRLSGIGDWLASGLEAQDGQGGARRRSSVTSSAVAPRPRSTACSRPASACRPSTRCTTSSTASWSPCAASTSSACRSSRAPACSRPSRRALRRGPHLLRVSRADEGRLPVA